MEHKVNIENLRASWRVKRLLSGRSWTERVTDHPLKAFFRQRNITCKKLAEALGVSMGSVQGWLNGLRPPSPPAETLLYQIAELIQQWESEHEQQFG